MTIRRILFSALFSASIFVAEAEVRMPSIFSDNMVLQQQTEAALWGQATAKGEISVTTSWDAKTYKTTANADGSWKQLVKTPTAGGPFEIMVSDGDTLTLHNILIGEVWLCSGQSNMEMPMRGFTGQPVSESNMAILKSTNKNIRLITVPRNADINPTTDFEGSWEEAAPLSVSRFSATGYYFGRLINEITDVPVGLINVSYGGSCVQAWMSKASTVPFRGRQIPASMDDIKERNRTPMALFNGMLSPVIGYNIRGCIWYQGETNYEEPDLYTELFPKMVSEWRSLWGIGDFPFYYCQIAPFDNSIFKTDVGEKANSAYLREAQLKCTSIIPNSAMAVLMDCGHKTCIHPADKYKAGERLALIALSKTYNLKGFGYASPEFKAMEIDGGTVTISFDNVANGITSFGRDITEFEIAGDDKNFYPATAFMRNKSIVLSSPRVKKPVAVRYAFKDFTSASIFNTEGLPLSSFRTDEW